MGNNYAAAWQHAIKEVQDWCFTTQLPGSAEAGAAYLSMMPSVKHVSDLPPPPKAVWKKLVLQLKV